MLNLQRCPAHPNTPTAGRLDMPQYRKRPVVIEARQWDGTAEGATPIIDWVLTGGGTARYHGSEAAPECNGPHGSAPFRYCPDCDWNDGPPTLHIDTLEGIMQAIPGDFIIRGVQGEFYPCKPDIFAATYEPAEDWPEEATK